MSSTLQSLSFHGKQCGESAQLGTTLQWQSLKLRMEMSWALNWGSVPLPAAWRGHGEQSGVSSQNRQLTAEIVG